MAEGWGKPEEEAPPRFPRLIDCAHFHYEQVDLESFQLCLTEEELKPLTAIDDDNIWFCVRISGKESSWVVRRSLKQFIQLDQQLHQCIYDRKFSLLKALTEEEDDATEKVSVNTLVSDYLSRLSTISGPLMNCGPVLNWMEMDNRGRHLLVVDDSAINTPAVAAALVVKGYDAQACDELCLKVRDMVSIIDMPPPAESVWWRGKHNYLVGFFPSECVELISDPTVQVLDSSPSRPLHRKHGKLMAFFRNFLLTRPSRRKLKQSGIYKERVFGCDLGEHLLNSSHEIPEVLRCCSDFIEEHGILDGIYRLSGINSNIQKLREAFDAAKIPDLCDPIIMKDIHSVSSLLKLYFRELPNPLLTHQLYPQFVQAIQYPDAARLQGIQQVVHQLPPPHYRTLVYLCRHLSRIAKYAHRTSMSARNLAIVWAPNLLWSPDINKEGAGITALRDVGVQAVVTEFLITYCDLVFCDRPPSTEESRLSSPDQCKKTRPKSLAISTPTKLLSLEEARSRAFGLTRNEDAYIEVGGGPSSLPPRYHTVLEGPNRARERSRGSLKLRSSWRNLFWRSRSRGKGSRESPGKILIQHMTPVRLQQGCAKTEVDVFNPSGSKRLRPVKSAESLVSSARSSLVGSPNNGAITEGEDKENTNPDVQKLYTQENEHHNRAHARTISHESYFDMLKVTSETIFNDSMDTDVDSLLEMKPIKDLGSPMSVDKYLFTFSNSMEEDRSPESILKEWGIMLDFGNKERNLQYSCSLQQLQKQDDSFNSKRKAASVPTLHYNPVLKKESLKKVSVEVPQLDSPCEEMEDALRVAKNAQEEEDSAEVMTVSEGISSLIQNVGDMETSHSTPTTGSSSILSPHHGAPSTPSTPLPVTTPHLRVIKADVHYENIESEESSPQPPNYENVQYEETPSTDEDVGVYENLGDMETKKDDACYENVQVKMVRVISDYENIPYGTLEEGEDAGVYEPVNVFRSPTSEKTDFTKQYSNKTTRDMDCSETTSADTTSESIETRSSMVDNYSPPFSDLECKLSLPLMRRSYSFSSTGSWRCASGEDLRRRFDSEIGRELVHEQKMRREIEEAHSPKLRNSLPSAMSKSSTCDEFYSRESQYSVAMQTTPEVVEKFVVSEEKVELITPNSESSNLPKTSDDLDSSKDNISIECDDKDKTEANTPGELEVCMVEGSPDSPAAEINPVPADGGQVFTKPPTPVSPNITSLLTEEKEVMDVAADSPVSKTEIMTMAEPFPIHSIKDTVIETETLKDGDDRLPKIDPSVKVALSRTRSPAFEPVELILCEEKASPVQNQDIIILDDTCSMTQFESIMKEDASDDCVFRKDSIDDEHSKRERIEKYKQERRNYLREKYRSESFRGEKDEVIQRLKQKVARLSSSQATGVEVDDVGEANVEETVVSVEESPKKSPCVVPGIALKRKIHPVETPSEPRFPDNKASKPKVSCRKVTPPRSLPVEETTRTKLVTRRIDAPKVERTTKGILPRLSSVEICSTEVKKSPTKMRLPISPTRPSLPTSPTRSAYNKDIVKKPFTKNEAVASESDTKQVVGVKSVRSPKLRSYNSAVIDNSKEKEPFSRQSSLSVECPSPVERQASPLEEVNVKERLNMWKRSEDTVTKSKYETPKVKVGQKKATTSPTHDTTSRAQRITDVTLSPVKGAVRTSYDKDIIIKRDFPKCLSATKTPQVKDKVAMFEKKPC